MGERIGVDELEPRSEWHLPHDFGVAPTGNLRDLVDIRGEPVGAV